MATIENTSTLKEYLGSLERAVKNKDKRGILSAYNVFSEHDFDWSKYSSSYFKKYDKLVDAGNDILYS